MNFFFVFYLENWYFTEIYLGVGFKKVFLATTIVALLSLYTIDFEEKLRLSLSKPNAPNKSFKASLNRNNSLSECESAAYSACRVDGYYSVYNSEIQVRGNP